MSADCVGRGANPRGPRHLPGEWSWGCASVSPPWWAQMEAQGREEGGDPGSGESSALRGCFSSPFSGLHGRSLQLLWPRGGHAQSLGESSSQTPSSPLLRRQPSLEHGARGGHTAPLRLPLSPLEPASAPVPCVCSGVGGWTVPHRCALPRNRAVRVTPGGQKPPDSAKPSRLSHSLSLPHPWHPGTVYRRARWGLGALILAQSD